LEGVDLRVVDPGTGRTIDGGGDGEVGELQVRSCNLMRGICGRTRGETFTADGYYATGDLGRIDDDGYVFFHGRLDDMFKVKGASVSPAEVEVVLASLPGIARAYVVPVEHDGALAVGAVVVAEPGVECTAESLTAAARQQLSAFKVPTHWRLVAHHDVPMLPTGKVDVAALEDLLSAPPALSPSPPGAESV
jgi:acyl-CoA synthetase (AMP-forming)/AMP-acid ligase II